ncbi:hypothetical protein TrRE_jg10462 [Triparma retinervis]|uniref:Uncharacterized protein n=1 Tax=Triparma retinervis TaxID=2557542 RepID=A0A9W7DZV5_9STRA|nr:hypothetical protein TrRE_jg10462 [Triparma retinervis]
MAQSFANNLKPPPQYTSLPTLFPGIYNDDGWLPMRRSSRALTMQQQQLLCALYIADEDGGCLMGVEFMEGNSIDSEDKILDYFATIEIRTFDDLVSSTNPRIQGCFHSVIQGVWHPVGFVAHMRRLGYDYSRGPGPMTDGNVLGGGDDNEGGGKDKDKEREARTRRFQTTTDSEGKGDVIDLT